MVCNVLDFVFFSMSHCMCSIMRTHPVSRESCLSLVVLERVPLMLDWSGFITFQDLICQNHIRPISKHTILLYLEFMLSSKFDMSLLNPRLWQISSSIDFFLTLTTRNSHFVKIRFKSAWFHVTVLKHFAVK